MKIDVSLLAKILTSEELLKPDDAATLNGLRDKNVEFVPFSADGSDYAINHFLDDSDELGYGYECTNKLIGNDKYMIFAIAEGDDALCIERSSGHIFLWLIQSANGKIIQLSTTIAKFLDISVAVVD